MDAERPYTTRRTQVNPVIVQRADVTKHIVHVEQQDLNVLNFVCVVQSRSISMKTWLNSATLMEPILCRTVKKMISVIFLTRWCYSLHLYVLDTKYDTSVVVITLYQTAINVSVNAKTPSDTEHNKQREYRLWKLFFEIGVSKSMGKNHFHVVCHWVAQKRFSGHLRNQ